MSSSSNTQTKKVRKKWGKVFEKTIIERDAVIDEEKAEEIENYIKHTNVLTPQEMANKHHIRVSLAKKILRKFAEDGIIHQKYKNGTHEIYKS